MNKPDPATHFVYLSCRERYNRFREQGGSVEEALWFLSELCLIHHDDYLGTCCFVAMQHLLQQRCEVKYVFPNIWSWSACDARDCYLVMGIRTRTEEYDWEVKGNGEQVSYSRCMPTTTEAEPTPKYFTLTMEFD